MLSRKSILAAILSLTVCTLAAAQSSALPTELKGSWFWAEQNLSQIFSLSAIKATSPEVATATLTWWTANTKCALREVPIELRTTETTIAFDATTKCDVSFTAELTKTPGGWKGKAVVKQGPVVELSAR